MANRLIHSRSPYLRQHADNPVDWFEWGEEAFSLARAQNKPIFLSIGYAACHWCHVMERESFRDPEVAQILNRHFVPIKVDREERPEVDECYITVVQLLTGSAGWPLSVFLTPELKPFYGGTYFPPVQRWGKPAFKDLLVAIADVWENKQDQIGVVSQEMVEALSRLACPPIHQGPYDRQQVQRAVRLVKESYDPIYGGFGPAPKFPPTGQLDLLMRLYRRSGDLELWQMVSHTLTKMAQGGIYDHIGGGFARYSTDAAWQVPHFEKMLYDNVLLAISYLDAFLISKDPFYQRIARETLHWMLTEMKSPEGGFYSSLDADSEELEGKFYLWTWKELEETLKKNELMVLKALFAITPEGNFEAGTNILYMKQDWERASHQLSIELSSLQDQWRKIRQKLYKVRYIRPHPARDEKILTNWNGLAIVALSRAGRVLQDPSVLASAQEIAHFLKGNMWKPSSLTGNGYILLHRWYDGYAELEGCLEDYAYLMWGLIELYFSDFNEDWVKWAIELSRTLEERLAFTPSSADNSTALGFYSSPPLNHLEVRFFHARDGSTPSGNAIVGLVYWRLWQLTGEERFLKWAEGIARTFASSLNDNPTAHLRLAALIDELTSPSLQIVITGPNKEGCQTYINEINTCYLPQAVLAGQFGLPFHSPSPIALNQGKSPVKGLPTVYICQDFSCRQPITDRDLLKETLRGLN